MAGADPGLYKDEKIPVIWLHPELLEQFEIWLATMNLRLLKFPDEAQSDDEGTVEYFIGLPSNPNGVPIVKP